MGQLNIDSIGHVNYRALHDANLNDVWGYEDETGREYAIVGTTKGTSIVDISDASNPVEVFWVAGAESIWRDPGGWGDFAYVTTEAQAGMLIIDLRPLPQSTNLPTTTYTGPNGANWFSAHTCYVEPNGYAYIFGANRGNKGAIILDVHTNPMQPVEVGVFDNWYVHDGFARNDTLYLAHILDGFFSIVDITDKSSPKLIAKQNTPNNFTHSVWPSVKGDYVFTTDEVASAFIASYNISDLAAIKEVDRTQHSPGKDVIPHNPYVLGDFLITSYYVDGVTIHDVSDPENMIKVGQYDTYPIDDKGFHGSWGVYPYFTSGKMIAADISEGLFILQPTYVKASYLKGTVTNVNSAQPIDQVQVLLANDDQIQLTSTAGTYKTGILGQGNYQVTYSKVGYYPKTVQVQLISGTYVIQDVALDPIIPFTFNLQVSATEDGTDLGDVYIQLKHPLITYNSTTNLLGQETFDLFYRDSYELIIGKWGRLTTCTTLVLNDQQNTVQINLAKGYSDDFTFDYNWSKGGTATKGKWERGDPNGVIGPSAPDDDFSGDCGLQAYVTGNKVTIYDNADDVSDGYVYLHSPQFDLSTYSDPYIHFATWMYSFRFNPSDDTLFAYISDDMFTQVLLKETQDMGVSNTWKMHTYRIKDYLNLNSSMRLQFYLSDNLVNNIVEGGVDNFYITEGPLHTNTLNQFEEVVISPNPADHYFTLIGSTTKEVTLMDTFGKSVQTLAVSPEGRVELSDTLAAGVYFVKVDQKIFRIVKR